MAVSSEENVGIGPKPVIKFVLQRHPVDKLRFIVVAILENFFSNGFMRHCGGGDKQLAI